MAFRSTHFRTALQSKLETIFKSETWNSALKFTISLPSFLRPFSSLYQSRVRCFNGWASQQCLTCPHYRMRCSTDLLYMDSQGDWGVVETENGLETTKHSLIHQLVGRCYCGHSISMCNALQQWGYLVPWCVSQRQGPLWEYIVWVVLPYFGFIGKEGRPYILPCDC